MFTNSLPGLTAITAAQVLTELDVSAIIPALTQVEDAGKTYLTLNMELPVKQDNTQVLGLRFQYTGPAGPQEEPGPQGDPGPIGPSGNFDLAGKRCGSLESIYGFDEDGNMLCSERGNIDPVSAPVQPVITSIEGPFVSLEQTFKDQCDIRHFLPSLEECYQWAEWLTTPSGLEKPSLNAYLGLVRLEGTAPAQTETQDFHIDFSVNEQCSGTWDGAVRSLVITAVGGHSTLEWTFRPLLHNLTNGIKRDGMGNFQAEVLVVKRQFTQTSTITAKSKERLLFSVCSSPVSVPMFP